MYYTPAKVYNFKFIKQIERLGNHTSVFRKEKYENLITNHSNQMLPMFNKNNSTKIVNKNGKT